MRIAFYVASALVAALSLAPSAALPPTAISDKAEHVIAYAVLGLLRVASSERRFVRTIIELSVFGIAIEMLQAFSPGRSPDPLDALADFVGVILGCGAAMLLGRMTSLLFDKSADSATPCRARDAGGDVQPASDTPAAALSSSHKGRSCESD